MYEPIEQLLSAGRAADAAARAEMALRELPHDARLNLLAGRALLAQGDAEAALDHFHLALHYAPDLADALTGRVQALEQLGRLAQVESAYREFLRANPGHAEAAFGLALALRSRGAWDEARAVLEAQLAETPRASELLGLLGLIRAREFGDLAEGEALVRSALEIDPLSAAARCNLGWILVLQRRYDEGLACLDQVLEREPNHHEARLMRAYSNLRRGEFALGWRDVEARHRSRLAIQRRVTRSRWQGEPIGDRTLVILAEQGLGDQIMYASCFPDALVRAGESARLVLECDPRLRVLFRRSFPRAEIIEVPEAAGPPDSLEAPARGDVQISAGSLPGLFRGSWADFPSHRGYLRADPGRVRAWRDRLNALSAHPKIGISWRGGSLHTRTRLRSIAPECWAPLLARRATFVSLQYGESASGVADFGAAAGAIVQDLSPDPDDYDDTAALVAALDLVISVCTAVVHLAGAMGKETWVLTPAIAEWRYLDAGEAMPWYPSARLRRQHPGETWAPVMGRVAADLDRWLLQPGSG